MEKTIKRIKKRIELNVRRYSKANRIKHMKTKALNGEKPVMPGFGYEENELREAALHQEALRIKNQIKAEKGTAEKGMKFKTIVFSEALAKVPGRIISKTTRKVKKYYKAHPE